MAVRLTHCQAAVLLGQCALRLARGVGVFKRNVANDRIAVPSVPRLTLARAFVAPGTERSPTGQTLRRTKACHIVADLDHD